MKGVAFIMSNTIYYVDSNNNNYTDINNNKFVYKLSAIPATFSIAYIYRNGSFKRARPIIIKTTDMGKIPADALMTNAGIPYLTNDKQFIRTTGSNNLTPESNENYILYEFIRYNPQLVL